MTAYRPQSPDLPFIRVVVVAYNGIQYTRACLASLATIGYPRFAIVLVDNGSSDGTAATLGAEHPDVEVLDLGENTGFTGGNNAGIRWCLERGCDAVLLLNNDTRVAPDFLRNMVRRLDGRTIVAPEIRSAEEPERVQDELGWFDWRRGVARPLHKQAVARAGKPPARIASGCCLLVPCTVFESIGLLDDQFFLYYEDVDFLVRAQIAGFRLVTEAAAVIWHHGRVSTGGVGKPSPTALYYNTRNRLYLMRKHCQAGPLFFVYFAVTRAVYGARYLLTGHFALVRSIVRAVRDYADGRFSRVNYHW